MSGATGPNPSVEGGGTLLTEPVLVVQEGADWITRKVARWRLGSEPLNEQPVYDRAGRRLATIQPVPASPGRTAQRIAYRVLTATVYPHCELAVVDAAGSLVLTLEAKGPELRVFEAAGRPLGRVRNLSTRDGGIDVCFDEPPAGERWGWLESTPLLASLVTGSSWLNKTQMFAPTECRIVDVAGRTVAGIASAEHRHVLELDGHVPEPLRSVVVGFACSLVDRRWLIPGNPGEDPQG